MPTNTYVALSTQTVAVATPSVTFTSIPQGYTDLVVAINAKNTVNGANCKFQLNGDTASNYSTTWMEGNGSSASSGRESNAASAFVYYNGSASTVNLTTAIVNIQNYTNPSTFKTVLTRFGNSQVGAYVSLWRKTPEAVTSVAFNALGENFQVGSTFTIYGIAAASVGAKATGGTIYQDANFFYHAFAGSGTFTPSQDITCDYLVVAGGGGGAWHSNNAGGQGAGGAGGLRSTVTATGGGGSLESAISVISGTPYAITVGGGGAGGATNISNGSSGTNSVLATITATGGGFGANVNGATSGNGGAGGSGGGGAQNGTIGGAASPVGQGFAGGGGGAGANGAGGGGGAGVAGGSTSNVNGGNGGNGIFTAISNAVNAGQLSGGNYYLAGGGGGGTYTGGTGGAGGLGGGTAGTLNTSAANATSNTGGGGGGVGSSTVGTRTAGAGGSGIVIVRYAK